MSYICEVTNMPHDQNRPKSSTASVVGFALAALLATACTPAAPAKTVSAEAPEAVAAAPASSTSVAAVSPVAEAPVQTGDNSAATTNPAKPVTAAISVPTPSPAKQPTALPQAPAATPATAAPPVVRVSTGLPPGSGRDVVQRACTSCHAIGMVTAKGRTSQEWGEIIGRMQGLGLEASDDDLYTIHQYLSRELPPRRGN